MRLLTTTLATAALTLAASSASAAYVSFLDEEEGEYGANKDSWTTTQDGATVEVTNQPKLGTSLSWEESDGFGVARNWWGVDSYEQDEIEGEESLTVEFQSGPVRVTSIDLTDLFYENGYQETGTASFFDEDGTLIGVVDITAPNVSVPNGEHTVDVQTELGDVLTSSVVFQAPGRVNGQNHEYSVAGIAFEAAAEAVPELDPRSGLAALGLLLGGLFMLTSRRRNGFVGA